MEGRFEGFVLRAVNLYSRTNFKLNYAIALAE